MAFPSRVAPALPECSSITPWLSTNTNTTSSSSAMASSWRSFLIRSVVLKRAATYAGHLMRHHTPPTA